MLLRSGFRAIKRARRLVRTLFASSSILSSWRGVSGHGGGFYISWRVNGLGGNMGLWGLDTVSGKYDSWANRRRTVVKWPGCVS
jgi:hypothetical protein